MRKTIVATLLALSLCPITNGSDINRVRKYIGDHGQSNAVYMVDFGLRDDSDGKGSYIDLWTYTNIAKPTIAQCPSDEVSDAWGINDDSQLMTNTYYSASTNKFNSITIMLVNTNWWHVLSGRGTWTATQ